MVLRQEGFLSVGCVGSDVVTSGALQHDCPVCITVSYNIKWVGIVKEFHKLVFLRGLQ